MSEKKVAKPFTKRQNFGLDQIESICRQQNICDANTKICFGKGRKGCGERTKCWLPAFSPLPTMFSKGYFFRVVIVKVLFVWKRVNPLPNCPNFIMIQREKLFKNIVGKGENAGKQYFLHFPRCFYMPHSGLVWLSLLLTE